MKAADIREAAVAELAEVHTACFPDGWSEDAFITILSMPTTFGFALRKSDGSAVVAFILCRRAADEAEILTLAVAPPFRRRGLARHLLQTTKAAAAAMGATRVHLEVAADNVAAGALYRGTGFAETGRRGAYYRRAGGKAVDAVLLAAGTG